MTIMGLDGWIHWASWFTRSLVFLTIADILIVVCYIVKIPLKSGGSSSVIGESDIFLVFFFLFSYSITSVCFMFLISTLFDKGTVTRPRTDSSSSSSSLSIVSLFSSQQLSRRHRWPVVSFLPSVCIYSTAIRNDVQSRENGHMPSA
jgi:hypothetical protein